MSIPDDVAERPDDAERHTVEPAQLGGPVDPPASRETVFATVTAVAETRRVPILPAWMRNAEQRRAFRRQTFGLAGYYLLLHLTRLPLYLALGAFYAPRGAWRLAARPLTWAAATQQTWGLMQEAANRNQPEEWRKLDAVRERHARWRFALLIPATVVLVVALVVGVHLTPRWAHLVAAVGLFVVLARLGRPADKPILTRVTLGRRFVRLTAEMVRNAVVALRLTGLKGPSELEFPLPIAVDGPGWLARFDLPPGLIAADVLEKRERLAGALRLPVDQVWPEVGPDHPAQVDMWVGFKPASKMGAPKWALAAPTARASVFEAHPFATDARGRPINIILFEKNVLLGGQPGSGKSFGARSLATIAGLDSICEMKVAEFKGTGDFLDMASLCTSYVCGVDDEAFDAGEAIIDWALAECERRGARIKKLREAGELPDGKVTPELAARKGSGLHPVFILIDEFHELLAARDVADKLERTIRRGRALAIIFVLATQIPDAKTVPSGITKCVSIRICMSVGDQVANDQILGTGAYKRGHSATMYRPGFDAGWGVMQGLERDGQTGRTYFPDKDTRKAIVDRMRQLRGATPAAPAGEKITVRDTLADARQVMRGAPGLSWEELATRLVELDPTVYAGWTADMARTTLARYGVQTQDVKVKTVEGWKTRRGAKSDHILAAIQRRELTDE